jgi:methylenetetrahydrofolate dehydrogenase (NADP+) / methenyltetrahydrofolate cyclohydrolase
LIIDGKKEAARIREEIKGKVEAMEKKPGLAVVIVGNDPASQIYVSGKEKACREAGLYSERHNLPENAREEDLMALIGKLNSDDRIHGILVQLPLPMHLSEEKVINSISPMKDVDGFHIINAGSLMIGKNAIIPCTPKGIIHLIESTGESIEGKDAVVIGRSNIVGKPVAMLLMQKNATVTICHSRTKDLKGKLLAADIIVAAIGKPNFVKGDMIKKGAIVIDVGINRLDGKLVGDVDFESSKDKASFITPVPGGVGPMTIAMLLENTLECYRRIENA